MIRILSYWRGMRVRIEILQHRRRDSFHTSILCRLALTVSTSDKQVEKHVPPGTFVKGKMCAFAVM